jgi:hypothetical protein
MQVHICDPRYFGVKGGELKSEASSMQKLETLPEK